MIFNNNAAAISPKDKHFSVHENVEQPIILDFSGVVVTGPVVFSVAGSGHLWRNLRVKNLTVYNGDVTLEGGAHDSVAGYEALYSFRFDNLCITDGDLIIEGNAFEGKFEGGRIERGDILIREGPASSLYFDAMTVMEGHIDSHIGDSHFHRMTVLRSPGAAIIQRNNISGSIVDCHMEQGNQEHPGPAVETANAVCIRNLYVIPGPKTQVGVRAYATGNRGEISGFSHAVPLARVEGSARDRWRVKVHSRSLRRP